MGCAAISARSPCCLRIAANRVWLHSIRMFIGEKVMTKSLYFAAFNLALSLALTSAAVAQEKEPTGGHAKQLVILAHPAKGNAKLNVMTPAYKDGADMPYENTQYRGNIFPGMNWTPGPAGTKSYVVVMQGILPKGDMTSIHFTLFNVPAKTTSLPVGLTTPPDGSTYGVTVHGDNNPYTGPHTHTPVRQPYHLQVLALDTVIDSDAKASFPMMEAAMDGHVLASGEVVGWSAKDPEAKE
jgi:para-nitrobenzyl esterase